MNFGPFGYTQEAGQLSLRCLPKLFKPWPGWQIVFAHSSVLLRDQENDISKRQFVLCTLTRSQVQESLQVEAFPVCFSEDSLNLNFAVSQSIAAKSSNLKRMFYLWKSNWGEINAGFKRILNSNPSHLHVCILKQQIKLSLRDLSQTSQQFCNYSKPLCFRRLQSSDTISAIIQQLQQKRACLVQTFAFITKQRAQWAVAEKCIQGESH